MEILRRGDIHVKVFREQLNVICKILTDTEYQSIKNSISFLNREQFKIEKAKEKRHYMCLLPKMLLI